MRKRFLFSLSSWFKVPEQGMQRFEILARASAFPVTQQNGELAFVTSAHACCPWRFPNYYADDWLQFVDERHTRYTVEIRHAHADLADVNAEAGDAGEGGAYAGVGVGVGVGEGEGEGEALAHLELHHRAHCHEHLDIAVLRMPRAPPPPLPPPGAASARAAHARGGAKADPLGPPGPSDWAAPGPGLGPRGHAALAAQLLEVAPLRLATPGEMLRVRGSAVLEPLTFHGHVLRPRDIDGEDRSLQVPRSVGGSLRQEREVADAVGGALSGRVLASTAEVLQLGMCGGPVTVADTGTGTGTGTIPVPCEESESGRGEGALPVCVGVLEGIVPADHPSSIAGNAAFVPAEQVSELLAQVLKEQEQEQEQEQEHETR